MISHLEPDILDYEVKWASGSITMNKTSEGDGIPVELFQIWKMMLWECCTQYGSISGKLSNGHRTGKGQFSFQSQRRGNAKECSKYCTVALISHASKVMLKILHGYPVVKSPPANAEDTDYIPGPGRSHIPQSN